MDKEQCCNNCKWSGLKIPGYNDIDCNCPLPEWLTYTDDLAYVCPDDGKECPCYITKEQENG
jgi:hypothetical protein